MTHQPAAVVGWVEKGCNAIEQATELSLRLLARSSLGMTEVVTLISSSFNRIEKVREKKKITNQEGRHPKDHVADVVGVGDVPRHHHLTGANGEVQTSQDPGENLKRDVPNKRLESNIGCSVIATCFPHCDELACLRSPRAHSF